ncbi:MAG: hypothetical protein KIS76_01820 [Pyrinomonadaceae bacterium]|nr:hypothetical protein [Pyrinomonadaceae bacterium]
MGTIGDRPGKFPTYGQAKISWGAEYLGESATIIAGNIGKGIINAIAGVPVLKPKNSYSDNKYEDDAKKVRRTIQEIAKKLLKSPCYP